MANWIYDDIKALLNTTTVIDGKVQRWATLPFVIVDSDGAELPSGTANESSFERSYPAVLTLHATTDAGLETLIETCLTAFSTAAQVMNPDRVYNRISRGGVKICSINIAKEEIIAPGAF